MGAKKEITTQLTKNLLDMIILEFLNKKAMHGYEIITSIRKDYGINFGPSTIYPLLSYAGKKGASSERLGYDYGKTQESLQAYRQREKYLSLL